MRSLHFATAFALVLAACGQQDPAGPVPAPADTPAQAPAAARPSDGIPPVAAAARAMLAETLGISEEKVVVLETRSVAWPSSALGCPDPDTMYAQVITPGWFIRLAVGSSEYRYHAGREGEPFVCHPARIEPGVEMSVD